jgi:hypothetical protein
MAKHKVEKDDATTKFKFKREKSHTFTILNGEKKEVGTVSIRPESIGWKPAGQSQWNRLSLKEFQNLIMQHGTKGEDI